MKHQNKKQHQEVVKGVNPHGTWGVSIGCPNENKNYSGDGIKIRGTGAATKGLRARGPMG